MAQVQKQMKNVRQKERKTKIIKNSQVLGQNNFKNNDIHVR